MGRILLPHREDEEAFQTSMARRRFLKGAFVAGSVLVALGGGAYIFASSEEEKKAREDKRTDGRSRLPPGQYLLSKIRAMGGTEGDPSPSAWKMSIGGEVENPFSIDMAGLLAMTQVEQTCDVHCVTKWTVLDSHWTGVKLAELAEKAKVRSSARHVIFESSPGGYTANVPIKEALAPNVLIAHKYEGTALARAHGAPVRAVVPDLYFWKSAKWLTGIRFVTNDRPGYWETRGYHNHADPWTEERYG